MSLEIETVLGTSPTLRACTSRAMTMERYAGELSTILAFVEQMNAVNTRGVVPMAHPLDMTQPLRADVVTEPDRRDEYQASAPAVRDGLYIVPKVIPKVTPKVTE